MKNFLLLSVLFFVSILIAGCEDLTDADIAMTKHSVFFKVTVNADSQRVYVFRTSRLDDPVNNGDWYQYNGYFDENAEITLSDHHIQDIPFCARKEDSRQYHYSNMEKFKGSPLTDYFLEVRAGNSLYTGQTTTPGDFQIKSPSAIKRFDSAKPVNFTWSRSANAKGYGIRIFIPGKYYKYRDFLLRDDFINVGQDSVYVFQYEDLSLGLEPVPADTCIFQVVAYDNNIFQHYFNSKESAGIQGAYGCFGSMILKEIKFLLK